jgi:hypothetical protein
MKVRAGARRPLDTHRRHKLVQKTDFHAALLASALIVSGVSVSAAETLDFSYVDSNGDTASWVQQSNPVCPGPGGCSFSPGPISGTSVPVTDGVESFFGGGGDSFTSVGFYAASSEGGFALNVLNTRQPAGYQLFTGTTAAPDFSALLTDSAINVGHDADRFHWTWLRRLSRLAQERRGRRLTPIVFVTRLSGGFRRSRAPGQHHAHGGEAGQDHRPG